MAGDADDTPYAILENGEQVRLSHLFLHLPGHPPIRHFESQEEADRHFDAGEKALNRALQDYLAMVKEADRIFASLRPDDATRDLPIVAEDFAAVVEASKWFREMILDNTILDKRDAGMVAFLAGIDTGRRVVRLAREMADAPILQKYANSGKGRAKGPKANKKRGGQKARRAKAIHRRLVSAARKEGKRPPKYETLRKKIAEEIKQEFNLKKLPAKSTVAGWLKK